MSDALWNQEAELAYVSAIVSSPDLLDKYPLQPSDLTEHEAGVCLRIALELREAGKEVAPLAVRSEATRQGATLSPLAPSWDVPYSHPALTHRTLVELAAARRIRAAMANAIKCAESLRVDEALTIIGDVLDASKRASEVKAETSYETALRVYEQIKSGSTPKLIPTGIARVDAVIGGLGPGSLTFLGGDTGVGKSSAMLFMADQMSKAGFRPGLVTCEDGPDVLGARLISLYSGVSGLKIRRGETKDSHSEIAGAMEKIRRNPIDIAYEIGSTDAEAVNAMTSLVKDKGSNVLFLDYIQTLNASDRAQDRRNELRRMCSRLKQCAARLGVPLIVGSQLTMGDVSDGSPKVPTKHMLKESRDLANMAEFVLLIWRDATSEDILGKLDKSKVGGDYTKFRFHRDPSGTLREVDDRY